MVGYMLEVTAMLATQEGLEGSGEIFDGRHRLNIFVVGVRLGSVLVWVWDWVWVGLIFVWFGLGLGLFWLVWLPPRRDLRGSGESFYGHRRRAEQAN